MLYAAPVITVYCVVLAVILGACMGSFLNCWAWRIVHGESVAQRAAPIAMPAAMRSPSGTWSPW